MLVKSTGTFCARSSRASRSPARLAGLDHRGVDADVVDLAAAVGDRLVPEPAHDELEQGADIVVRFADEDPGHACRIDLRPQGLRDPDGMKPV